MLGRFFRRGKVRPGFFFPRGKIYTGILFPGVILSRGGFSGGSSMRGGTLCYNTGILSRMHFRRIVNAGPKRKASECMPLTTGKMSFYALLTLE